MKIKNKFTLAILAFSLIFNSYASEVSKSGIVFSKENFSNSLKCVLSSIKGAGEILYITTLGSIVIAAVGPGEIIISPHLKDSTPLLPMIADDMKKFNQDIITKIHNEESCKKTQKAKNEVAILESQKRSSKEHKPVYKNSNNFLENEKNTAAE